MKTKLIVSIVGAVIVAFGAGWFVAGLRAKPQAPASNVASQPAATQVEHWTCPMHPQVDLPDPGKCPICGMKLVLRKPHDAQLGPRDLEMSESGLSLAEIVTAPVERKLVEKQVRMVGMVDYDETRVSTISAWIPGRLDRLYVDFTGTSVRKGDHLVWLYSPELLTAQEELLEQLRLVEKSKNERSQFLRKSSLEALESARDKLRLWGLSDEQIRAIEKRGTAEDHMMIESPTTGIVIHKALLQGAYVKTGTPIYRIAQLDQLWVQLDAYESDLPWIRYGQDVDIETEAYPGEVFRGWISFVAPELDRKTRTVKVRVNVKNADHKLKPGMFVRALVRSRIAAGGRVMAPRLAGKWICPMHPEVVEDAKEDCPICGMELVRAEELGYVSRTAPATKPLVVPVTAVLWTGKRSVVYVKRKGPKPVYEGREIVIGPRAGDYYLVFEGLEEGEQVVVQGNFKIDSALQILAKPSMMSVKGEPASKAAVPSAFRVALVPAWTAYFELADALAGDDSARGKQAFAALGKAISAVKAIGLPPKPHGVWLSEADVLAQAVVDAAAAKDIAALRAAFAKASKALLEIDDAIGHSGRQPFYEAFCPMAFDGKGASWLQQNDEVRNPFYGSSMLTCGEVRDVRPGSGQGIDAPAAPKSRAAPKAADPAFEPVYLAYATIHDALTKDRFKAALRGFVALGKAAAAVRMTDLVAVAKAGAAARDIASARVEFKRASTAVIAAIANGGNPGSRERVEVFCPMAFGGKGASWLQAGADVRNPYYGAVMLDCGSVKRRFQASGKRR